MLLQTLILTLASLLIFEIWDGDWLLWFLSAFVVFGEYRRVRIVKNQATPIFKLSIKHGLF
jgi:hypothetical protein